MPFAAPIGYRVWDLKDGLFTSTKGGDVEIATPIVNGVSQSVFAIGFRLVIVLHRVVSAILIMVAAGYWMGEASELRDPTVSGNPLLLGHQAWVLFFVAVLLDLIYSTILTLGALGASFLPASNAQTGMYSYLTKDTLIKLYAEMGSYADIFRYMVQMVTSIVILIYATDAMNLHNVFNDCEPIEWDAGFVQQLKGMEAVPSVFTATDATHSDVANYQDFRDNTMRGRSFAAQRALMAWFYRVRRHTDASNAHDMFMDNTPMSTTAPGIVGDNMIKMGAGTCTVTATPGGPSYHTCLVVIAVMLLLRFVLNTFGLWCFFAADRPYYIFPISCAGQRKKMGARIQKQYATTTDAAARKAIEQAADASAPLNQRLVAAAFVNPQVPVVPVQGMQDQDPEGMQAAMVPELSHSMTCGGWVEPFWYNILGSLRMHEYVGYLFYIIAFFILAGAANTPIEDVTYMPKAAYDATYQAASKASPYSYANHMTTQGQPCSYFANPNDPTTAQHFGSLYTPNLKFNLDYNGKGPTLNQLSNTWYSPAQYSCDTSGKTWPETFYDGGSFESGCCASNKMATPYSNVLDPQGEQTNPMYVFSILVLVGSIFYLISSLAYAAAIFGLNQAPIPQITVNSADPRPFEGGI